MASRRNAGFTLLELMVVVTITAILLTYAVPSISRSLADRRAAVAAGELTLLLKQAQEHAQNGDTAYAVSIQPGFGVTTNGRAILLRGTGGRCEREDWLAASAACPPGPNNPGVIDPCVAQLDLNDAEWNSAPNGVRLREVPLNQEADPRPALRTAPSVGNLTLCFETGGGMFWFRGNLAANIVFTNNNLVPAGGFVFALAGYNPTANTFTGVPRVVAMPMGGTARRIR